MAAAARPARGHRTPRLRTPSRQNPRIVDENGHWSGCVSAPFDDLRDTPLGLHFAKVSSRGRARAGTKVAVFEGSMLATAAVSAPRMMLRSAAATLEGFGDLSDDEREMLFDTFRAWLDNDASVRASADILFVHPNTVRKRLRRIEQRTGLSLSRPRDVVELTLALEVHNRLM